MTHFEYHHHLYFCLASTKNGWAHYTYQCNSTDHTVILFSIFSILNIVINSNYLWERYKVGKKHIPDSTDYTVPSNPSTLCCRTKCPGGGVGPDTTPPIWVEFKQSSRGGNNMCFKLDTRVIPSCRASHGLADRVRATGGVESVETVPSSGNLDLVEMLQLLPCAWCLRLGLYTILYIMHVS